MSYASVMMSSWWNPNPPDWVSFHINHQQQNNRGNHDDEDEKAKIINMDLEELMSYVLNHDDSKIEELMELDQESGNDIYLIRRKDAMKMTKLASLHSKASRDAYRKGDHISAQELSLKAQVERAAGEILHAKAAKEILSIKNRNNDMWKLDLHGLHAIEAVQALGEHLQRIECEVSVSQRQRRRSLLVITGRGSHSRGQPVLPAAIKSFLSKNRYDFEDSRPGVIKVQPKFSLFTADHLQGWNCFPPMPLHAYVQGLNCLPPMPLHAYVL